MAADVAEHFMQDIGRESWRPLYEPRAVEIHRDKEGLAALWLAPC
jgi:hypothetical protein